MAEREVIEKLIASRRAYKAWVTRNGAKVHRIAHNEGEDPSTLEEYLHKNSFLKYPLSNVGNVCDNPIKTNDECKEASNSLESTIYVGTKGIGIQLPTGCVFDNVTPGKTYVYWNKDGGVKSYDPKLRTICQPISFSP